MEPDHLNAAYYGASRQWPGWPRQHCIAESHRRIWDRGGGTLFIPEGVCELTRSIAVSTDAPGAIRITGDRIPTLLQPEDNNVIVVTGASSGRFGHVIFEGLHFKGSLAAPIS
jgi:hypothetical protein